MIKRESPSFKMPELSEVTCLSSDAYFNILLLDKFFHLPTFNIRLFTRKTWSNRIEKIAKVVCKNFIVSSLCTLTLSTSKLQNICWSARPVKPMKFPIWTFLRVFFFKHILVVTLTHHDFSKETVNNPENWNLLSSTQYDFPNFICCNHRFLLWFNNNGWLAANTTQGSTSPYKNTTCNNHFTKWIIFIASSLIYHSPLFEEQYM